MSTPIAVTIAGSDSGGGAGIQADIKAFSALGVYGASVLTALTAQNTREVRAIEDVSPAFIAAQIDTVFDDLAVPLVHYLLEAEEAQEVGAWKTTLEALGAGFGRDHVARVLLELLPDLDARVQRHVESLKLSY